MKSSSLPALDLRYWLGILLASVVGTNLGDLYAHTSGLPLLTGVAVLAALCAVVLTVQYFDSRSRELYYWLVILIIRTGATNLADYAAFRVRIPELPLNVALAALLTGFAALHVVLHPGDRRAAPTRTSAAYWLAMLAAGVLGTTLGDVAAHVFGQGIAAVGLLLLLTALLWWRGPRVDCFHYWLIVAVARTAGTAVGDWLAGTPLLRLGLPLATLVSGIAFVLVLGRGRRPAMG